MSRPLNPAIIGALVRERREAAGLTQTQLAERIGASRFWIAAFEKGKPSVELGLALKAIQALGMSLQLGADGDSAIEPAGGPLGGSLAHRSGHATLAHILAQTSLPNVAPSAVVGWPGAAAPDA